MKEDNDQDRVKMYALPGRLIVSIHKTSQIELIADVKADHSSRNTDTR